MVHRIASENIPVQRILPKTLDYQEWSLKGLPVHYGFLFVLFCFNY